MMRLPARALALILAAFPAATLALGLGNVEVTTALNEPLRAEIPITGVRPGEAGVIEVRLGTDEQFRRAGIERPFHLTRLKFNVVPDGERNAHIEVTTDESITEPFLNFLVEINWPSGRMIREYTLLLDPPVYGAAISSSSKQSIARLESVPEGSGGSAPKPLTEPRPAAAAEPPPPPPPPRVAPPKAAAPSVASSQPAPRPAAAPAAGAPTAAPMAPPELTGIDRYGPVVANESLWSIAKRVRPEGVSIQRMMFAILDANREAFFLNNINALKKGAVLRIPDRGEIGLDEKALAMAEVRRHQAIWDDYRSQLAGAPSPTPEGAQATVPGTTRSATVPGTTRSNDSASDGSFAATAGEDSARLQLVAAGASPNAGVPGDQSDLTQLRQNLNVALEDADSKQRENQELGERLRETEQIIKDLNRMLELKDDEIARLQNQLRQQEDAPVQAAEPAPAATTAEPEPAPEPVPGFGAAAPEPEPAAGFGAATTEPAAEPETPPEPAAAVAPEPEPAAPVQAESAPKSEPKPAAAPPPQPEQVSFVDELWTTASGYINTASGYIPSSVDPILLAGGLGIVLILGGGLAVYRRRQAAEADVELEAIDFEEDDQDVLAVVDEFKQDDTTQQDVGSVLIADDETLDQGSDAATVESVDEDPLSELNIYMAYEHFDQAEDLVRRAIADHPDRHEYRLKLLEVFYASKNVAAFQQAAGELRDAIGADGPHIATAVGWWNDLAPGQDLFGTAQPQGGEWEGSSTAVENIDDEVFDVTSGTGDNEESAVDFDLGFEMTGTGDDKEDTQDSSLDLELDSGESEDSIPAGAESSPDVEFDLSELEGESANESDAAGIGDLEFETQKSSGAAAFGADDDGLNFDLADDGVDANQDDLADSAFDMNLDLGTVDDGAAEAEAPKEDNALDFEFDIARSDTGGSGDAFGGLELEPSDEPDTSAEADGDLTSVDERLEEDAEDDAELGAVSDLSDEGDLALDFDIGEDRDDKKGGSDDWDLGIGMDSDGERENSDSDFSIEGGTNEALSWSSEEDVGAGSEVDFEIGGDDDGEQKMGIDTVFKGVFDDSAEDASREGGGSDDDPLGIGGGSSDLPKLDSDTEDAVELTFLGNNTSSGTDAGDILDDLEFGDENTGDASEAYARTEYMLRDVPKPHAGDTDVASNADSGNGSSELDDIQTKLDLAEAYIEMGDTDGARGILGEVMSEGSQNQQDQAKDLLQKLG